VGTKFFSPWYKKVVIGQMFLQYFNIFLKGGHEV
jgi:hypothetical protein